MTKHSYTDTKRGRVEKTEKDRTRKKARGQNGMYNKIGFNFGRGMGNWKKFITKIK